MNVIFLQTNNNYFIEKKFQILDLIENFEIKNFLLNHWAGKLLLHKIKNNNIIFYDCSREDIAQKQLNSIFGLICLRKYENKYIQDLYYLHEFFHLASLNIKEYVTFYQFKKTISINELFSSLFSECFIYYFIPEILNKTFDNLWLKTLIKKDYKLNIQDINVYNIFSNNPKELNQIFQQIFFHRIYLRNVLDSTDLNLHEKTIFNYNNQREVWLEKFKHNNIYQKIIIAKKLSDLGNQQEHFNYILHNKQNNGKFFHTNI